MGRKVPRIEVSRFCLRKGLLNIGGKPGNPILKIFCVFAFVIKPEHLRRHIRFPRQHRRQHQNNAPVKSQSILDDAAGTLSSIKADFCSFLQESLAR